MSKVSKMPYNQYSGVNTWSYADPTATVGPAPTLEQFERQDGQGGRGMFDPYWTQGSQYDTSAYNRALSQYQKDLMAAGAATGRNPDGSPMAPEFQSLIDPETGQLRGNLSFDADRIEGFDKFKNFAMSDGPSEYAQASEDRLGLQTALERDRASREANQAGAQARSNLAMRGGLSSGARERIAGQVGKGAMQSRQMARQNQLLGLSDILTQDAGARQQALGSLTDWGARSQEFNIQNALGEIGQERDAAFQTYTEEGKRWAAEKKAAAQRAAAGCFAEGTLIEMQDGTRKPIEEIVIGDVTLDGGRVYGTYAQAWDEEIYNYGGVLVTGQHLVRENGVWLRIRDSKVAMKSELRPKVVYDFSNTEHRIRVGVITFGDFAENDDFYLTEEESLAQLNG
jgi:hypothetical protein